MSFNPSPCSSCFFLCFLLISYILNSNLENMTWSFFFFISLQAHVLRLLFILRYLNGSHVLQLGGVNENISYEYPQLQHKHYTGCIRNLLIDSKVKQKASRVQCIPMAGWIDCYIVELDFLPVWMTGPTGDGGLYFNKNVNVTSRMHRETRWMLMLFAHHFFFFSPPSWSDLLRLSLSVSVSPKYPQVQKQKDIQGFRL